jgi:hypothetical protein
MKNANAVFRGTITAVNVYIMIEENLGVVLYAFHIKKLEKEEPPKHRTRGRKEIVKMRADINEMENRKTIPPKSMKLKVGSLKTSTKLTNLQLW